MIFYVLPIIICFLYSSYSLIRWGSIYLEGDWDKDSTYTGPLFMLMYMFFCCIPIINWMLLLPMFVYFTPSEYHKDYVKSNGKKSNGITKT
jgi:hypothetical protein